MDKEQITWRSISSQAVTSRWNAGTPTYYVIDGKGLIRYKWVGSPGEKAIDGALERVIGEVEGERKKEGKLSQTVGTPSNGLERARWQIEVGSARQNLPN